MQKKTLKKSYTKLQNYHETFYHARFYIEACHEFATPAALRLGKTATFVDTSHCHSVARLWQRYGIRPGRFENRMQIFGAEIKNHK